MAVAAGPGPGLHPLDAAGAEDAAAGQRPAAAERVGLVEEDDHPAVAHGQFAQLAEQGLDLQHSDAHEHLDESARVDEDERLARLARHGLGHERLARPRRAPQEDAAGHVTAPGLDRVGVLQENDALLHPGQHGVLAPNMGEPGLDVVGEIDVHPAFGEEPENGGELADGDHEDEHHVGQVAEDADELAGEREQRRDGAFVQRRARL